LNEKQRVSLARYIRDCADIVGLRDWEVVLDDGYCEDDDIAAHVYSVRERRIAHITVAENFITMPAHEQRHVIAHELVHVHMDADLDYLDDFLPGLVGSSAWTPIRAALRAFHEQGIDGVSVGVEAALPLWKP